MVGRITDQSSTQYFQRTNSIAQATIDKYNRQITSGKRFEKPSESPADTSIVLSHERRLARIDQFTRNATSAQQWLNAADQALQSSSNSIAHARTLTVQGLNSGAGTLGPTAAAAEIRQVRDQLLGTANTTMAGRSIFNGTANGAAYDSTGTYLGDTGGVTRALDTYEVLTINQNGPEVFGTSNPGDPLNGTIFERLDAIATALETGDQATASAGLASLDDAMARVSSSLGKVGAMANRLDVTQVRLGDESVTTLKRLSDTQDADMAEAIMHLRSAETSYEALLATSGRAMSTSLLDFMR